jgi:SH3-like domain-containing protein
MTVLTRKKTTRKPVRKRAAAKKSGGSFGTVGWLAATAIAVGWIVSDGRAVAFVRDLVETEAPRVASTARPSPARPAAARPAAPDAISAVIERSRMPDAPRPPRPVATPTHLAAIAPSPAPRPVALRMPRDPAPAARPPAPAKASAPVPPRALAPQAVEAPRSVALPAMNASAAPAGGLRHATRQLDMRAGPDEAARRVGSVGIGMQVEVLRSDGRWRYVRGSEAEGWVDGTFLAGESAASVEQRPPAQQAAMPTAPAPRIALSAPVPPMAITHR